MGGQSPPVPLAASATSVDARLRRAHTRATPAARLSSFPERLLLLGAPLSLRIRRVAGFQNDSEPRWSRDFRQGFLRP